VLARCVRLILTCLFSRPMRACQMCKVNTDLFVFEADACSPDV